MHYYSCHAIYCSHIDDSNNNIDYVINLRAHFEKCLSIDQLHCKKFCGLSSPQSIVENNFPLTCGLLATALWCIVYVVHIVHIIGYVMWTMHNYLHHKAYVCVCVCVY